MSVSIEKMMPKKLDIGTLCSFCVAELIHRNERYLDSNNSSGKENRIFGFKIPSWQRPLVWTESQNISFLENLWRGIPPGTYAFNSKFDNQDLDQLLIDGQQRLNAINLYILDKFSVFGMLFSETSIAEKRRFENITFPAYKLESNSMIYLKNYYNIMNFGGTPHTQEQRA